MSLFALEYRFGQDTEHRLAVRSDHRAYLEKLRDQGQVVAAGPFDNDSGALIIYRVDSREALERILAQDPYVKQDVFGTRSLREWRPFITGQLDAG